MIRNFRFAFAGSALVAMVALAVPVTAFAGDAHGVRQGEHGREHRGHHARGDVAKRALTLTSLSSAQRVQVEALAQEEQTARVPAHAARAKVLTAQAGQVDRGAIDRAALGPALKEETDAITAARLRERSIAERLHVVLTAAQCSELGGGKDFLGPAPTEADVRARAERHAARRIDGLEKKVSTKSADERTHLAAKLRERAAR